MKNIDITTGEFIENEPPTQERELTAKERNRKAQFERLLTASAQARQIRELMINTAKSMQQAMFLEAQPLNYFILNYVYKPAQEGTHEFKKFNEWKQEGFTIIKGSKAFPVWSQPTKRDRKQGEGESEAPQPAMMENANPTDENGNGQGREYFNMCYLFSNLQVTRKDTAASGDSDSETEPAAAVAAAPMEQPEPIAIF